MIMSGEGGESGSQITQFVKKKRKPGSQASMNPKPLKHPKKDPLAFKSSYLPPNCYFSNFFGGSEFTFMSKRTPNPRLCRLYIALRDREWDTPNGYKNFQKCREKLMGKKIYKEKYRDPYYKTADQKVAAGLLAKLISGCWRKRMVNRLKIVNVLANKLLGPVSEGDSDITHHDFSHECLDSSEWTYLKQDRLNPIVCITATNVTVKNAYVINGWLIRDDTVENKKKWMMEALAFKYRQPFFNRLLETHGDMYEAKSGCDPTQLWSGITQEKDGVPVGGLLQWCLRETRQSNRQSESQ